jgi:transposase
MHISGKAKDQLTLLPLCLADYIGADHVCRAIAAFVERLDLVSLGYKYAESSANGRPSYNPASMRQRLTAMSR